MLHILLKTLEPHKDAMNKRRPYEDFTCPKCGAAYKLVRMPAPADSRDPPLHCKICSQQFAPTDNGNILKYFLVGRRRRSRSGALTATEQP
jgi:prepilin signal peptidase PulO-like enzyme (type II secretory pathway)